MYPGEKKNDNRTCTRKEQTVCIHFWGLHTYCTLLCACLKMDVPDLEEIQWNSVCWWLFRILNPSLVMEIMTQLRLWIRNVHVASIFLVTCPTTRTYLCTHTFEYVHCASEHRISYCMRQQVTRHEKTHHCWCKYDTCRTTRCPVLYYIQFDAIACSDHFENIACHRGLVLSSWGIFKGCSIQFWPIAMCSVHIVMHDVVWWLPKLGWRLSSHARMNRMV